jgi:hypothetical protein
MPKTPKEIISEHYATIGKRGGLSKNPEKQSASRKNLEKALEKRWGKKFKLVSRDE